MLPSTTTTYTKDPHADADAADDASCGLSADFMCQRIADMLQRVSTDKIAFVYHFLRKSLI
jgi:hypothetical protein